MAETSTESYAPTTFQRRSGLGSSAVGICRLHGEPGPAAGEPTGRGRGEGKGERMLVNGAVIAGKGAETAKGRSAEEIEQIRLVLRSRFDDLNSEYEDAVAQNQRLRL